MHGSHELSFQAFAKHWQRVCDLLFAEQGLPESQTMSALLVVVGEVACLVQEASSSWAPIMLCKGETHRLISRGENVMSPLKRCVLEVSGVLVPRLIKKDQKMLTQS